MTLRCAISHVSILVLGLGLAACKKEDKPAPGGGGEPKSGGAATPSASAAPAASASAGVDAAVVSYPAQKIPAGKAKSGAWTAAYTVERQLGNEGLALDKAAKFCADQGKALCTETQWQRACEADPKLGALETWTLTLEGSNAVVLGGAAGCQARQTAAASATSLSRVATCCERAVAITTKNENEAFLLTATKRLLDYEQAAKKAGGAKLRALLDDPVVYAGAEKKQDEVVAAFEAMAAGAWTVFDACTVNIEQEGSEARLVSDCKLVYQNGGTLVADTLRLVHGGPDSKLQLIGKEADMALLAKEKKERVRSFIGD